MNTLESLTLTPDKQAALELLRRYRVLTLQQWAMIVQVSVDAVRMRAERLIHDGLIIKTQLSSGDLAYALTGRAARHFGLHWHSEWPFAAHGMLQHGSIAQFCARGGYVRLLPEEFREQYPDCHRPNLPAQNYCVDPSDTNGIIFIIVDHASEPRRFFSRVAKAISARMPLCGFAKRINSGEFAIVVITATEAKRTQIEKHLNDRGPLSVPVTAIAIPFISQFWLESPNRKGSKS